MAGGRGHHPPSGGIALIFAQVFGGKQIDGSQNLLLGVVPVSYTHLDVYKRQDRKMPFFARSLTGRAVMSSP